MCSANERNLSLNGDTFDILKEQFDKILNRTIGNMEMKGADDAVITLKLSVGLEKSSVNVGGDIKEVTKPTFKHDISSVMQVKDKVSGQTTDDYALVWDESEGKYVLRKIENGQMSFDDYNTYDSVDAEYEELPAHENERSEAAESEEEIEEGNYPTDSEETIPDVLESSENTSSDEEELTPYGWLKQFVGSELKVTEAMGNYTVRSEDNKVVLSSATDPSNIFYCDADKLAGHVDHVLKCECGWGSDTEDSNKCIKIVCADCDEEIFRMYDDAADEDEGGSYNYEEPEE